jgi:hypothetical protein
MVNMSRQRTMKMKKARKKRKKIVRPSKHRNGLSMT